MNSGARILAIEDDVLLASHLQQHLSQCGFAVTLQHDGARGLAQACNEEFDLVLLDVLLPGRNGLEALAELRCRRSVPVILMSALGAEQDRIAGFSQGADDYLPKPFAMAELEARVRALVRRSGGAADTPLPGQSPVWCGLQVDRDNGAVYHEGQPLELPPRELALLRAVLARPGQAIAKERLTELVFPGEAQVQPEAIEVVAYRLRKKIAHTGTQLVTLRGLGYLIKASA